MAFDCINDNVYVTSLPVNVRSRCFYQYTTWCQAFCPYQPINESTVPRDTQSWIC